MHIYKHVAVSAYPWPRPDALELVFWYAGYADSAQVPVHYSREGWQYGVELLWVNAWAAAGMMTFKDHEMAVEKVLDDVKKSGHDMRVISWGATPSQQTSGGRML